MSHATLLISQQSLYPHAGCTWVQKAREAVRFCRDNGHTVITSVGVPTRNLVTALCAIEKTSCELIIPSQEQSGISPLLAEYGLSANDTIITFTNSTNSKLTKETRLHHIDDDILRHSDIVIPVCIRSNGYMQKTLEAARQEGKAIITGFETAYERSSVHAGYTIQPDSVSSDIRSFSEPFLIHWTRASIAPWPDEQAIDYYRSVIDSHSYPRTAFDTLLRILSDNTIIASSRHIADSTAVVAFSSLPPYEVIPLMKWRQRYRQMSFEPYGIGIRYLRGLELGIRPVTYRHSSEIKSVQTSDRWLTQSQGRFTDWRRECEYRHRGDFDLNRLSAGDICIFTRTESEALRISGRFGLRTVWFEK